MNTTNASESTPFLPPTGIAGPSTALSVATACCSGPPVSAGGTVRDRAAWGNSGHGEGAGLTRKGRHGRSNTLQGPVILCMAEHIRGCRLLINAHFDVNPALAGCEESKTRSFAD